MSAAAGPLTAAPPTIGLTPTTGADVAPSASAMPVTERIGPIDVIAVAQVEPRVGAVCRHRAEALERLVDEPPAAHDVELPGERVGHGVEIGRDVESPDLRVVAGVADDGEVTRGDERREASQQLGGAGAAGERD